MSEIHIMHQNKVYVLDKDKVLFVLNALQNKKIKKISNAEIEKMFADFGLNDEYFLENINKLWE